MTAKILRSVIGNPDKFSEIVTQHALNLADYDKHIASVKKGKAQHYPPPVVHNLVSMAVRKDGSQYIIDYELVDDPSPSFPDLESHKAHLMHQVSLAETILMNYVIPRGKSRLWNIMANDIRKADLERRRVIVDAPDFDASTVNIADRVEAGRSSKDTEFLKYYNGRLALTDKISRHAANLHSQIEDLTKETIGDWKLSPFPAG